MTELTIKVGGEYLTLSGIKVFIIKQMMPTDHDYVEGYPYMDGEGIIYSEAGVSYNTKFDSLDKEVYPLPEDNTVDAASNPKEDITVDNKSFTQQIDDLVDEHIAKRDQPIEDQPVDPNAIKVELGATYIDSDGLRVKMVHEFVETDVDYQQGFRFRSHDNYNYTADGDVIGHAGRARIVQLGAHKLVSKVMTLALNNFYRNGIDQVVLIIGEIAPGTGWYKNGLRFSDNRGNFYTAEGSVKSWLWSKIDCVAQVDPLDVTDAQMKFISDTTLALVKRQVFCEKFKKMIPFVNSSSPVRDATNTGPYAAEAA